MGGRNSRERPLEDQYKTNGVVSTTPSSADKDLPAPKPPGKTKKQLLKSAKFATCDDRANKVPYANTTSVQSLTSYLTANLTSDVQKVRVIYYWITHNIAYDTTPNFHNRGISTDAASVLRYRKTVCIGYANLFAEMCKLSKIPVKIITGYCKGFGYNQETAFSTSMETDHAWNAVHIQGGWHFIECTWGAGYRDDSGRFIKRFSEFHFLTRPKHFIAAHYPYINNDISESKKWQLLKRPIDIETFSKRLKGMARMYELGVKPKSHLHSVVDVDKSVEILLQHPKSEDLIVTARLYSKTGQNLDQYVMAKRKGAGQVSVRVIPPRRGDYMLHLFGKTDPDVAELDALLIYVLKCKEAEDSVTPYPQHTGLWGAYSDFAVSGLHKSASKTIERRVRNGQLQMKLKTTKPVESIVKLEHSTSKMNDSESYALLHRDGNHLLVNARFPYKGKYKLSIFTKNESASTYSPRMCYLIHCDNAMSPCKQFPKEFQQTTQFSCRLLEPLNRDLPANTNIRFRISSSKLAQARVENDVMTRRGNVWSVTVKTPQIGRVIKLLGSDGKGENYWALYHFNVV